MSEPPEFIVAGPGVPTDKPVYWMHEGSGKMRPIIEKFLKDEALTEWELGVMRWYVHQWIEWVQFKPDDYDKVMSMSQQELREYLSGELLDYGIDPL
jgi:hypothetical protein